MCCPHSPSLPATAVALSTILCLAAGPLLAAPKRSAKPAAPKGATPRLELENLHLEYRFGASEEYRLVVSSSDRGPGTALVTLFGPYGRRLDQVRTRMVEGVRFIDRRDRLPFVELQTGGGGTGVRSHRLDWFCLDRQRLENVFSLATEVNRLPAADAREGADPSEHEDSQIQLVQPSQGGYLFDHPAWPTLRIRTTRQTWREGKEGRPLQSSRVEVTEAQWEFSPATRKYQEKSRRNVSTGEETHQDSR